MLDQRPNKFGRPYQNAALNRRSIVGRREATRRNRRIVMLAGAIAAVWLVFAWLGHSNTKTSSANNTESTPAAVATIPEKKIKIGLQAGHWKNDELPDEFGSRLRIEGTGGYAGGVNEWEVNLDIAQSAAELLRDKGYEVDVLPATVPEGYTADAFVALHADGNDDTSVSGFKVGASEWGKTEESAELKSYMEETYSTATNLDLDPNITDDMTQYFSFNYIKYHHTVSAETPAVLIELGFITNAQDRRLLTNSSQTVAKGVADGIIKYIESRTLATEETSDQS